MNWRPLEPQEIVTLLSLREVLVRYAMLRDLIGTDLEDLVVRGAVVDGDDGRVTIAIPSLGLFKDRDPITFEHYDGELVTPVPVVQAIEEEST